MTYAQVCEKLGFDPFVNPPPEPEMDPDFIDENYRSPCSIALSKLSPEEFEVVYQECVARRKLQ